MGLHAQLWLLLLAARGSRLTSKMHSLGVPVFMWSEPALGMRIPRLRAAFDRSLQALATETDLNHVRYYWFHFSLLLWHQQCGREYPRLRYVWRLEPDVVFAGSLATLLQLSSRASADLLLPALWSFEQTSQRYRHWEANAEPLRQVPVAKRVWSMVSISRLSVRFLTRWLGSGWNSGQSLVYEEIGLPVTCLMIDGCTLAEFGLSSGLGLHIVYKPAWGCAQALRSRKRCSNAIYHPVKDRGCLLDFYEQVPNDVYDAPRYSCAGSLRRRTLPAPPQTVWIGSAHGDSPRLAPALARKGSRHSRHAVSFKGRWGMWINRNATGGEAINVG